MTYLDRDKYGIYKTSAGPGPALMGADTLIGDEVVNTRDEDLGDIKEIMLDTRTGQVANAVLSMGGFLGIGEKLFAVPWQALHLDTQNKRFVLDVDKQRLQNAPGFDPKSWPDMSDIRWSDQIHQFWGTSPMGGGLGNIPSQGAGAGSGSGMRS
jgi:sporulation protein YlmC with PRC-barrel domain